MKVPQPFQRLWYSQGRGFVPCYNATLGNGPGLMFTLRSASWYWVLAWTIGMWLAAIAMLVATVASTEQATSPADWIPLGVAALSALLAAWGTRRLIKMRKGV
jgi:hypothetical protein